MSVMIRFCCPHIIKCYRYSLEVYVRLSRLCRFRAVKQMPDSEELHRQETASH